MSYKTLSKICGCWCLTASLLLASCAPPQGPVTAGAEPGLLPTQSFAAARERSEPSKPVIPHDRLLTDEELVSLLDVQRYPKLQAIQTTFAQDQEAGLRALAEYFRGAYAERYLFDWRRVDERFAEFKELYAGARGGHERKKDIHLGLYPADVQWKLPFTNLEGRQVTAYELRHLARQHKVLDMAYMHLYEDRKPEYVDYFTTQMRSLQKAFARGEFEDDDGGNGVFEVYRGGTRVIQWLTIHGFFLGSDRYDFRDQIDLIRSFLLEGALLNAKNPRYKKGNHQTRGLNALGMLAVLFDEYQGTGIWYATAMNRLEEHLTREVYPDGFQFERTIHYHVADIKNYFNLYQLAKINGFPISETWSSQLEAMFESLLILARPDGKLPVSGDDTDRPWSEHNQLGSIMLLGAILFDDPRVNHFADDDLPGSLYWALRADVIAKLSSREKQPPTLGSASLPDTGFYVMRDGWEPSSLYMNISAGLTARKSDHQHGDMLGVTAYGRKRELLPNYTVRYPLPDLEYFKNSLSKNVAIVDSVLHGRKWKPNKGGSGFGKWLRFPQPRVITWQTTPDWDYFAGTHDGYEKEGVEYYRKVFFLKNVGWFVRDIFESSAQHDYQQIWQGHYSVERDPNHFRSTNASGAGLEILQLGDQPTKTSTSSKRGKGQLMYTLPAESAQLTTLLFPFGRFSRRLAHDFSGKSQLELGDWSIERRLDEPLAFHGVVTDADVMAHSKSQFMLLGVTTLKTSRGELRLASKSDLLVVQSEAGWGVTLWLHAPIRVDFTGLEVHEAGGQAASSGSVRQPGETLRLSL